MGPLSLYFCRPHEPFAPGLDDFAVLAPLESSKFFSLAGAH